MTATSPARTGSSRLRPIILVVIGGAVGAAFREALSLLIPALGPVPISIAIINVIGAFALGYLYEGVTRLGPSSDRAKSLKLLLGTGFCGGFTTYSSLATDTAVLIHGGHLGVSIVYALGTVVVGACATVAGIALASRINERALSAAAATSPTETD